MKPANTHPRLDADNETRIRELAYFFWVDAGCPAGDDLTHWLAAETQVLLDTPVPAPANSSPHFSIRETVAQHDSDPTHRFHDPSKSHDARTDVVAGEARQRVRGRHSGTPRG